MKNKDYVIIHIDRELLYMVLFLIGLAVFILMVYCTISVLSGHEYNKGYFNGKRDNSDEIFSRIRNSTDKYGQVSFTYADGNTLYLYKEQHPIFCNWKLTNISFIGEQA